MQKKNYFEPFTAGISVSIGKLTAKASETVRSHKKCNILLAVKTVISLKLWSI